MAFRRPFRGQKLAERYLKHSGRTCSVGSPVEVDDGQGGQLRTWAWAEPDICFIKADIRRPYEVPVGGGVVSNNMVEIHMKLGTVVRASDRVKDSENREFEVVTVQNDDESVVTTIQTIELT